MSTENRILTAGQVVLLELETVRSKLKIWEYLNSVPVEKWSANDERMLRDLERRN